MTIDFEGLLKLAGKAMKVKEEMNRLDENEKRIYELSRLLPDEEGYELVHIYKQSLKDKEKIMKVASEIK